MTPQRLQDITAKYNSLRIAIVGDFCLDRYLEIDPERAETSIETGLPVYNVVRTRAQPGAAGTVLNNLVALGIGTIFPVGFCGEDGEGWELKRSLQYLPGVSLEYFFATPERRTFTYCKPLVMELSGPPRELNRLDSKNWGPTSTTVSARLVAAIDALLPAVDAGIVLDQVDLAETGVVTAPVLSRFAAPGARGKLVIADSRRGLRGYPPIVFKMNAAELAALTGETETLSLEAVYSKARQLAEQNGRDVFVTLSERGLVGATARGEISHIPAYPVRGPIDIVGAGDSVTANLTAALAGGASIAEALTLAAAASSIVIHELGTTGTASVPQIADLLRAYAS